MPLLRAIPLLLAAPFLAFAQADSCAQLHSAVQSTYNFKPSKLNKADQQQKAADMDKVWNLVESRSAAMLPCLVTEMGRDDADPWFLYDAGALLAKLDPDASARTNRLILRGCELVDLADVDLGDWVQRLTTLALQDVDISTAAGRWMRYPRASFVIPQHAFEAKVPEGAFFLYGSMQEAFAAPSLLKIAADPTHPQRELALSLLGNLVTPEADTAFRSVDLADFPAEAQTAAKSLIASRTPIERRNPPKSTRDEILAVLRPAALREFGPFMQLMEKVSDGERDYVAVLKPEDLPLLRRVRRAMAASGNPHLMEAYPYFTGIIWTLQQPAL